jgi:hypothetical protein
MKHIKKIKPKKDVQVSGGGGVACIPNEITRR